MPIRPENRARYPKNWKSEVVPRIRLRSGNRCECTGQCGGHVGRCERLHGEFGYRDEEGMWVRLAKAAPYLDMRAEVAHLVDGYKVVQIILTVAHLNHTPEDCSDENLLHCCQRCHNRIDRAHRIGNAQRTVKAKKAIGDLFCDPTG